MRANSFSRRLRRLAALLLTLLLVGCAKTQVDYANLAYEKGDYDSALTKYRQAIATDPRLLSDDKDAQMRYTGAHLSVRRRAVDTLLNTPVNDKTAAAYRREFAALHTLCTGDDNLTAVAPFLALEQELSEAALTALSDWAARRLNTADGYAQRDAILAEAETLGGDPAKLARLRDSAVDQDVLALVAAGDFAVARERLRILIRDTNDSPANRDMLRQVDARLAEAERLRQRFERELSARRLTEAATTLDKAREREPKHADLVDADTRLAEHRARAESHRKTATAARETGDVAEALKHYEASLRIDLDPDAALAWKTLTRARILQRERDSSPEAAFVDALRSYETGRVLVNEERALSETIELPRLRAAVLAASKPQLRLTGDTGFIHDLRIPAEPNVTANSPVYEVVVRYRADADVTQLGKERVSTRVTRQVTEPNPAHATIRDAVIRAEKDLDRSYDRMRDAYRDYGRDAEKLANTPPEKSRTTSLESRRLDSERRDYETSKETLTRKLVELAGTPATRVVDVTDSLDYTEGRDRLAGHAVVELVYPDRPTETLRSAVDVVAEFLLPETSTVAIAARPRTLAREAGLTTLRQESLIKTRVALELASRGFARERHRKTLADARNDAERFVAKTRLLALDGQTERIDASWSALADDLS